MKIVGALALLAGLTLAPSGAGGAPRAFTVADAQRAFRAETGQRLVVFRAASTANVTSLRTRPHYTKRFGEFQLFVVRAGNVERMRRVFTHGVAPDARGIHWVSNGAGGWIAVQVFERNLILAWFPTHRFRETDASFTRVSRAVRRFAPLVRDRPAG